MRRARLGTAMPAEMDPYCRRAVPGDGELGDPVADPLGDLEGLGGCGTGEQQGEFLAAEPAAQVAVAQQVPHGGGDRGEHGVPGEVAVETERSDPLGRRLRQLS